jgi:putative ABC transport system substrate-binding protein
MKTFLTNKRTNFSTAKLSLLSLRLGALLFSLFLITHQSLSAEIFKPRITVSQLVAHPALDAARNGVKDALNDQGFGENSIDWVYENAYGQLPVATQIAQRAVGQNSDVIVAIPTTSAQAAQAVAARTQTPIVFVSVTDPVGANLVKSLENPGKNITGVSNRLDVMPQFELFRELVPNLKRIGIVYNPGEANSQTMLLDMKKAAKELGIVLMTAPAVKSSEVKTAAQAIATKVDALFINNDNTALAAFASVAQVGNQQNIPVFVSDTDLVDQGALAALGPNQYQVGYQAGLMTARILHGEKPGDIAVEFPTTKELVLNEAAAKKLGIVFSDCLRKRADRIIP